MSLKKENRKENQNKYLHLVFVRRGHLIMESLETQPLEISINVMFFLLWGEYCLNHSGNNFHVFRFAMLHKSIPQQNWISFTGGIK